MNARLGVLAVAMTAALTACGAGAEPTTSTPSTTPTGASPSPTSSEATPEQVASVIAGKQADWREVIEQAGTCRMNWVMKSEDLAETLNRKSCYTREVTAGLTAQAAIRDLGRLTVPSSMTTLVDKTTAALQQVIDVDLESACGPASGEPSGTDECNKALGQRMWAYNSLGDALDMWAPYL